VGGKTYNVKVLGTDPTDDVALIKLVGASGLPPVKTGDPTKLTPGQPIVAVGNAGGVGGTPSVATGTVTDLDQSVTASDLDGGDSEQLSGLIQINAPLEPGDSGGPLLTAAGLVVGMDTAASTSGSDQSQTSIGFAIPITRAVAIAQQIAAGHTSQTIQLGLPGFLGVSVFETNPTTTTGADIQLLLPGSPAGKAGLVAGDVITSIDGQAVTSSKNLTVVMQHRQPGDKVTVGYTSLSGASQSVSVTLSTGPAA
jgi:S1-C subfamily serine protease